MFLLIDDVIVDNGVVICTAAIIDDADYGGDNDGALCGVVVVAVDVLITVLLLLMVMMLVMVILCVFVTVMVIFPLHLTTKLLTTVKEIQRRDKLPGERKQKEDN